MLRPRGVVSLGGLENGERVRDLSAVDGDIDPVAVAGHEAERLRVEVVDPRLRRGVVAELIRSCARLAGGAYVSTGSLPALVLQEASFETAIVTGPGAFWSVIAAPPQLSCTLTGITLPFLPVFGTGVAGSVDWTSGCRNWPANDGGGEMVNCDA